MWHPYFGILSSKCDNMDFTSIESLPPNQILASIRKDKRISSMISSGVFCDPLQEDEIQAIFEHIIKHDDSNTLTKLLEITQYDIDYNVFYEACKRGCVDIIPILISYGYDINHLGLGDPDLENQPIHVAAERGHIELVKLLLDYNANIDARNSLQRGPIHIACNNKNRELAKMLVERGAYMGKTLTRRYSQIVKIHILPIKKNRKSSRPHNTNLVEISKPVIIAIKKKREIFDFLTSGGRVLEGPQCQRITTKKTQCKFQATYGNFCKRHRENGEIERSVILPNKDNFWATNALLSKCIIKEDTDTLLRLLEINQPVIDNDLLHKACYQGYSKVVPILLDHGYDMYHVDEYGCRPLHNACVKDNVEIVEILLDRNMDIDIRNDISQRTALHVACNNNSCKTIKLLISRGAGVNVKDKKYATPLSLCCENRHLHRRRTEVTIQVHNVDTIAVIKLLLNKGAVVSKNLEKKYPRLLEKTLFDVPFDILNALVEDNIEEAISGIDNLTNVNVQIMNVNLIGYILLTTSDNITPAKIKIIEYFLAKKPDIANIDGRGKCHKSYCSEELLNSIKFE